MAVRDEVCVDIVKSYLADNRRQGLKLIVIGEAGQGKSTLINALLGKEVATEGETFKAGTTQIKQYCLNQNDVLIQIWDTPGFGLESEEEDEKMVERLREGNWKPDLALFCFRMDSMRFPTRIHTDTIKKFTEVFGKNFWKHTLFVLTFANNVNQLCPRNEELDQFFSNRVWDLEEEIKKTLCKHVDLSADILNKVRAVPVGTYKQGHDRDNPWKLPDREDWFVWFWMECTEHMLQASVSALLQANYHRIKVVKETAPPYGEPFPNPFKQPYERSIDATADEAKQLTKPLEDPSQIVSAERMITEVTNEQMDIPINIPPDDELQTNGAVTSFGCENLSASTENVHSRDLPIYDVLLNQLDDENSSFATYVREYAKKGGESIPGIGHVVGFIQGLAKWLGKRSRIRQRQRQNTCA